MKIVAVTGCFDVLHVGHVRLIKYAQQYGKIIMGINSDRTIRLLKGNSRPVNNQNDRKEFLESIKKVFKVFIVDDINMIEFLKLHRPQFWIKGADYSLDTINQKEKEIVESFGGKIIFAPYVQEKSTTNILKHLHD